MGLWDNLRERRRREQPPQGEPDDETAPREAAEPTPPSSGAPPPAAGQEGARGLSGWLERRAQRVVRGAYEAHAEDLEERAQRIVNSAYEHSADDMEERAVRAMRRAIEAEAGRIRATIEHAVAVKKREVRLSLIVLVVSSLVYLALYWFTHRPEGA